LPKEIELAQAGVRESTARLQFSKTEYDRARRLRGNANAISQGELELARSQFLADQESATSAKIEYDKLLSTKDLRLTQAKLNIEVAIQEVKRLVDLKSKYKITAPFDSVVTQKLTDVGEWVTKGQAVVEVLQLDPIQLVVNAPQEQLQLILSSISKSTDDNPLSAEIRVEGIDEKLNGTVKSIVSQADLRSRTFPVRIEIENRKIGDGFALQPGMLGRATLLVGAIAEMTVVKKDALVLGAGETSVFKVDSRGASKVAVEVPVQTGPAFGEWIQVVGDISVDDQVVLLGNERLKTGDEISISKKVNDQP
jgi:RND family efflux transporter MFP subunit